MLNLRESQERRFPFTNASSPVYLVSVAIIAPRDEPASCVQTAKNGNIGAKFNPAGSHRGIRRIFTCRDKKRTQSLWGWF